MYYDVIIVGGGLAGSVCGYMLSRYGYKCLVLERNNSSKEKVCGGAVPFKAINLLNNIGINTKSIITSGGKIIRGFQVYRCGIMKNYDYNNGEYGIGTKRILLDELLRCEARNQGAVIRYNELVKKIDSRNGIYTVNGYNASQIIVATGARGLIENNIPGAIDKQSFGISSHIVGKTDIDPHRFHFWYFNNINEDEYFWAFPIGSNLWNIGIWCKYQNKDIKKKYIDNYKRYIEGNFHDIKCILRPKGEYLGNVKLINIENPTVLVVGDAAGTNDISSGEGIYFAIKSAVDLCNGFSA